MLLLLGAVLNTGPGLLKFKLYMPGKVGSVANNLIYRQDQQGPVRVSNLPKATLAVAVGAWLGTLSGPLLLTVPFPKS